MGAQISILPLDSHKMGDFQPRISSVVSRERMFRGIMELSCQGTFVPRNESSMGGTFVPWNFRSQEPSFPGTFDPKSEIYIELSFPNSKIINLYKLNTSRRRHNLIVYLLRRRPTLMM